ncbi:MAG: outer membrane beta-barrel protein [Bacteroidia bacterium]|nr:outer membrane beta-barrel protein [Bacteroidia bacterium]
MNRTSILFTLFLVWTLSAIGQDNQEVETESWKVGSYFMPSLVFKEESSNRFSFAPVLGFRIEKQLSNQLTLRTGLNYSNTIIDHGDWGGAFCDSTMESCTRISETSYLEIPLDLKYYFLKEKRKINSYLKFGVITSMSVRNSNEITRSVDNGAMVIVYVDNRFRYQQNYFSGAIGAEFKLAGNVEILIEPGFRYSFLALTQLADFTNYTLMVGLGVGVNYKF